MHPEILRELGTQRGRELRARAQQARLARMAGRARPAPRRGRDDTGGPVISAVPAFTDGSCTAGPAEGAGGKAGGVPERPAA